MTDRLLSVGNDFALRPIVKVLDENLPERLAPEALAADFAPADATATALGEKAPVYSPAFTGTPTGITKAHVGLGNVDNTTDANKPVSTAQATAIAGKVSKGEQVNHAKDFGLVGDGSNEFTKLQNLFNAGGIIILEPGKVYGYEVTATLTMKAGTTLLTNGSTFKELVSMSDTTTFRVNGESYIDSLRLDLAGGDTARGLLIAGDNTVIEQINVKARVLSGIDNYRRRGLVVGIEGTGSKNVRIGSAWVENWDYSVAVFDSERITFDALHMRNSRQGLLANDVVGLTINSGTDEIMSPHATGGPGENSILTASTRDHHTFRQLRVSDFVSKDASEHAFRIGGQFQSKDIWFTRCKAVGAGAALGSGGCGFKVLGPTSIMDSNAKHSNIFFINCIVENSKNLTGANTEAFHVGKSRNVVIDNPIVRAASVPPSYAEGAISAYHGIRLFGVEKVAINNPQIEKCQQYGIWIHDQADDAVTNNGGGIGNVYIKGGILGQNPTHVYIDTPATARRIVVDTTTDAGNYSVYATATSVLNRCTFEVNSYSPVTANFSGLSGATTILRGDIVGTPSGRGGSTYTDYTTGRTYLNSTGGWKTLRLSGTTANRPTNAVVGDDYYDTTLSKPVWLKTTPSTWIDATGATV